MVAAAATMGTGSVALNTKLRAVCLMSSTTSVAPEDDPADAAEHLREGRHDHGHAALEVEVFEHAAAVGAEGARAVGVVDDQHGAVALAHLLISASFPLSPSSE
jgi:hypothetical protein